jgi:hypothetical protein
VPKWQGAVKPQAKLLTPSTCHFTASVAALPPLSRQPINLQLTFSHHFPGSAVLLVSALKSEGLGLRGGTHRQEDCCCGHCIDASLFNKQCWGGSNVDFVPVIVTSQWSVIPLCPALKASIDNECAIAGPVFAVHNLFLCYLLLPVLLLSSRAGLILPWLVALGKDITGPVKCG